MENIREQVYRIISQTLNIEPETVNDSLSVGDIPQWDSVGNLAIINQIEHQLSVEIPIEDLFELTSVGTIVKEIEKIVDA